MLKSFLFYLGKFLFMDIIIIFGLRRAASSSIQLQPNNRLPTPKTSIMAALGTNINVIDDFLWDPRRAMAAEPSATSSLGY
jgi:hypothetical protein